MEAAGKDAARSAEEEALKRSTDCVYFLASPLTCKKGAECEYRHSEGARVNPRDCWFWLNGNCLNPKCSFRHPPLDGLIGTPTASTGPSLPVQPKLSNQASLTHSSAAHNPNKQGVPCYYFQRGGCLKGDRCLYSHGAPPMSNTASQQASKVSGLVSEPVQSIKKTSWTLDKGSQHNTPKETTHRPTEIVPPSVKPPARAVTPVNGLPTKEILQLQSHVEFPSLPEAGDPLGDVNVSSRSQSRQSEPLDDNFQNEGEGDGYFRESSPGFDVLVDDENEDPGYFCDEDELDAAPGHDGRSLNPAADYEYHPSSDYESATRFRGESFGDAGEYARVRGSDYYTPEHHGAFSERALDLPSAPDRRPRREDNASMIDGSDLRHRLLKKRRVNASRSGVCPDRNDVRRSEVHYNEERRYRARGHRNDPRNAARDVPVGKRLQGRISLPRNIPVDNSGDRYSEREVGRNLSRSSPNRPTHHHPRGLHDRINRRSSERFRSEENNHAAFSTRSDEPVTSDFVGPKRLFELKSRKVSEPGSSGGNENSLSREQRNTRTGKASSHREVDPTAFEGPQPFSVILKRKREASAANSVPFGNKDVNDGSMFSSATSAAATIGSQVRQSPESARTDDHEVDPEAAAVDIEEEDPMVADVDQLPVKEGADGVEEYAPEYNDEEGEYAEYEQGDEEYYQDEDAEYEQEGGEDVYEEEAEGNGEGDDDYAKKLAVCN